MSDEQPFLHYDAAQMRLLLESPAWKVLEKHVKGIRDGMLTAWLLPPDIPQPSRDAARGAYNLCNTILLLPQQVIENERYYREQSGRQH